MDFIKQVFDNAGSDKCGSHSYQNVYSLVLEYVDLLRERPEDRDNATHIMEIGYETGAGTFGLSRLMPKWNFVSVDIDYTTDKYPQLMKPRFDKIQCDTGNREVIKAISSYLDCIKFGLIIDDGSHILEHQKSCLEEFWRLLVPGGIYLIEDVYDLNHAYQFKDWPGFVAMDTRPLGSSNDICVVMKKLYEDR